MARPPRLRLHGRSRAAASTPATEPPDTAAALTIRWARDEDALAVEQLAGLDGADPPPGAVLIAELDGELIAALPVTGGRPIANPFRPAAGIVRLLEFHADQLNGRSHAHRRSTRKAAS
jgi:hypothetical protein